MHQERAPGRSAALVASPSSGRQRGYSDFSSSGGEASPMPSTGGHAWAGPRVAEARLSTARAWRRICGGGSVPAGSSTVKAEEPGS